MLEMTPNGLSSGRSGAGAVREAFAEFVSAAERAAPGLELRALIRPGRPEAAIRRRFAEQGVAPPDELVAYWMCQDGMEEASGMGGLALWDPVHLDRAIRERSSRVEYWDPSLPDMDWADPGWFELTADHSLVARIDLPSEAPIPVRRVDPGVHELNEDTNEHQLESIATLFDLMSEGIRVGQIVPRASEPWAWGVDGSRWHEFTHGVGIF
jgi:hypothetical protein